MKEVIAEASHTSFKTIEKWQEEISCTVTDLLKALCKEVKDVKIFVDCPVPTTESCDPLETSKVKTTTILVLVPPIKVEVSGGVIDLGTP